MQITSSLMKFQKCKCSYKLIEIEINWFSLGIIDLYQLPAASCYVRNGLCMITQTLHKRGSFMSSEISSGWRLGALLFSTPLGCPASRKRLQPPAAQDSEGRQVSQQGWQQSWPWQTLTDGRAKTWGDRTQPNFSQSIVKGQLPHAWKSLKKAYLLW